MGMLKSLSSIAVSQADKYKDDEQLSKFFNDLFEVLDSIDNQYSDMSSIISYLQSKSSKGLIREIPAAPGDICYVVDESEGVIDRQLKVDHIEINQGGIDVWLDEEDGSYSCYEGAAFGEILFTDYTEALEMCHRIQSNNPQKIAE